MFSHFIFPTSFFSLILIFCWNINIYIFFDKKTISLPLSHQSNLYSLFPHSYLPHSSLPISPSKISHKRKIKKLIQKKLESVQYFLCYKVIYMAFWVLSIHHVIFLICFRTIFLIILPSG